MYIHPTRKRYQKPRTGGAFSGNGLTAELTVRRTVSETKMEQFEATLLEFQLRRVLSAKKAGNTPPEGT